MANPYLAFQTHVAATAQSQPIPGREAVMTPNNAGGYGFVLDDWERLNRFLITGSESGTYYVSEKDLTKQNFENTIRCIKADGVRTVTAAYDVNYKNRAPKVDQQLFVLALAMKYGDDATKKAVANVAPAMLRTGTHFLHFAAMLDSLGGWSRAKRRLISAWFAQDASKVAYQVLKYQNRDGWTMRDVARLAHYKPAPDAVANDAVMAWVAGKLTPDKHLFLPMVLEEHRQMLEMDNTPVEKALWGIDRGLPREALPTEALTDVVVQRAMLPQMPIHALIRNLGNLTASKLLDNPEMAGIVAEKLVNKKTLSRSRVHPFAILLATLVYGTGRGVRGGKTWTPVESVLSALEDAYDLAFDHVQPTNKRILIGIDISGSMNASCIGTPIAACTAAAAMAVTLARIEPHATVVQFDTEVKKIVPITKRTGIAGLESAYGGATDLAAPVYWAGSNGDRYDAFTILTDNETWAGSRHPTQMFQDYRQKFSPRAKLVCASMAANHANIVDPDDAGQFGCAGLDSNLPQLISDFISR